MKTLLTLTTVIACLTLSAQEPPPARGGGLAERFKQLDRNDDGKVSREEGGSLPFFDAAEKNKDGFLTFGEAEAHAQQSAASALNRTVGMEGDGAGPVTSRVKPMQIPETESPIQTLDAKAADGRAVRAFWRQPKGDGPFPAIVFIHGGLTQFPEEQLRRQVLVNPVITRMLADGYAVLQATFRTYEQDVQSRGPIEDVRAVVQALAKSPGVDARRIALFGGSGGGSIALELGGDPAVRAVIAGEPATVLYTGMLTTGEYGPRIEIMAEPERYFTPELRRRTLERLRNLRAPVLILHSDQHALHKLNGPLFVPLMKEAGIKVEYREYPGFGHGFYFGGGDDRWGKGADIAVVEAVVRDVRRFLDETMPAAAPPRPAATGLSERFKQLDRNGDGRLTREEIPRLFDQFDKNKDGVVTLKEAQATGDAQPAAGPTPKSSSQAFLDLRFVKDYFPGATDRNGKLMGGVECNFIVAHIGKLYATVSTWKQVGYQRGETTGPQVLVKKAHDAPWEVDMTFGPYYGRAECLRSVTFTTDRTGRRLDSPVSLLLATTTGFGSKEIGVWSRDDATGRWTRMTFGKASSAWGTEIRTLSDHVDRVTGTHSVFAAATEGLIYRGAYDPQTPGGIVWEPQPEYRRPATMKEQRSPSSCEFDGVLYVSLETDPQSPGAGGVFRRVDGPKPRWEHVYEWKHAAAEQEARIGHKFDRNIYGLAGVSDPRDPSRETLICTRNMLAQVLGIDPTKTDKATIEFDARRYFEKEFQSDRAKVERIAANGFTPVTHPDTGEKVHLAGVWAAHPAGADTEKGNSSWYLVRHADGTYAHGRVWTPDDPVPNKGVSGGLRTTRSICLSPFPEDKGRVLYFGGFDSGISTSKEEFGYTAWIYRGTLPNVKKEKP